MAFDATKAKPTAWIPSWAEDGTSVSFPIASVPEMTAAEADGDTGDFRKVLYALLCQAYAVYAALGAADRPGSMVMFKRTMDGLEGDGMEVTFNVVFKTTISVMDVADEPS